MVGTGPARVAMNEHKATWEGAGPRTSVSPTMIPHHQLRLAVVGAPEISPATRFSFDKWRPGHAGPGPGGGGGHHTHRYLSIHHTHRSTIFVRDTFQSTTPTDAPLSSKIPFNPPTDPLFSSKIPFPSQYHPIWARAAVHSILQQCTSTSPQ